MLGNALAGRLLKSLLDRDVPILTGTAVRELVRVDPRIAGAVLEGPRDETRVEARCGVVLATGGFSHDPAMRARYLPCEVSAHSPFAEGSTGDGLRLGTAAGGIIEDDNTDNAYWTPASVWRRSEFFAVAEVLAAAMGYAFHARPHWGMICPLTREEADRLSRRFGPWYYVIDKSLFDQLKPKREDLVQAKKPDGPDNGK